MSGARRRALVYGDVNLNLIDGSATWVQSVTQTLAAAGCDVTLVLKAPVETERLVGAIESTAAVTVVRTYEEGLAPEPTRSVLSPGQVAEVLRRIDVRSPADLLVLRGQAVAHAVATDGAFEGRLWTYLTDVPQWAGAVDTEGVDRLTTIAVASRFLLCQTEELRCFLEATVPAAAGRCVLFPPVVPAVPAADLRHSAGGGPLRLVYTGKMAPRWNTLQMTALPAALQRRGVPAELHVVGDKIHDDKEHPAFAADMRRALKAPGVVWHGGVARAEALRIAAGADIGLGWRDPSLDASLELSTKVLEFGALGLPVALNRTPMHERLLGADYPLFVDTRAAVVDALAAAAADASLYRLAAERARAAAQDYDLTAAAARLRRYLSEAFPDAPALHRGPRPLRVVVAGHDLKFFTRLLAHLQSLVGVEVRVDEWAALARHDERRSKELRDWADVVVCEWCGPVAVWYSRTKRAGQRLVVRLHRFELDTPYPSQVSIDNVDQVVCVSPHYANLTRERTGWPAEKIAVVPNAVDVGQFDRPKLPGARFHIGFLGVAPMRKRLDLAVDVIDRVRREDRRFTFFAKTKMPWDYWWIWNKPEERAHFDAVLRRVQGSPRLRDAVVFDRFGPDVPAWLRKIGFVLSTSDDESFHLAPAEGMASGAVPVIRRWPGAESIYGDRWTSPDPEAMAARIQELSSPAAWEESREAARAQVTAAFDAARVCRDFEGLLTENLPAAAGTSLVPPAGRAAVGL